MIEPPTPLTIKDPTRNIRFSVQFVKDGSQGGIDPPWLPRISPEILKFRFSLHMVKDDWPHPQKF